MHSRLLARVLAGGSLLYPATVWAEAHPCALDARGEACAASCAADGGHESCHQTCLDISGVKWCDAHCAAHPELECRDDGRDEEAERAFDGPMLRLGVRGALSAQLYDDPGAAAGAEVLLGARLSRELSLVWALSALPLGVSARGDWILAAAGELGVAVLLFDGLGEQHALSLSGTVGVWLPNACRAQVDCLVAAPLGTLRALFLDFGESPNPETGIFSALSFGLAASAGFDPTFGEVLGRISLLAGFELAAY